MNDKQKYDILKDRIAALAIQLRQISVFYPSDYQNGMQESRFMIANWLTDILNGVEKL